MNESKFVSWRTGSIVVFFILLFVYSKWGPALPFTVFTQQKGDPFIVSGEGKVVVTPDIAKITLGFEESGQILKQVQDSVNKKSRNLTEELKKLGIKESDIKTINYNVYPQYDWENPLRKITGYQVSINYEVEVKEFDKINEILSVSSSLEVNSIGNISFDVNEKTKEEKTQEARELAVSEAKEKAQGLAKASGITLGKIINVSEQKSGNLNLKLAHSIPETGGGDTSIQPDIQPGDTEIIINISLSYDVR